MFVFILIFMTWSLGAETVSIGEVCSSNDNCLEGECVLISEGKKQCQICDYFDPQDPYPCETNADCCSRNCEGGFCQCSSQNKWCEKDSDCCKSLSCLDDTCQYQSCSSNDECKDPNHCVHNQCKACKLWDYDFVESCVSSDDCCSGRCISEECFCSTHHENENWCEEDNDCCQGSTGKLTYICQDEKCCVKDNLECLKSSECCSEFCDEKTKKCTKKPEPPELSSFYYDDDDDSSCVPVGSKCAAQADDYCSCCSTSAGTSTNCACSGGGLKSTKKCCIGEGGLCGQSGDCCGSSDVICSNGTCYKDSVGGGACFSSNSILIRHDGSKIKLIDAKIGDIILTVTDEGTIDKTEIVMIQLHPQTSRKIKKIRYSVINDKEEEESLSLYITENHYLYFSSSKSSVNDILQSKNMKLANEIHVGDFIVVAKNEVTKVGQIISIEEEDTKEVGTVYTTSGKLIVDGVLASSYSISNLNRSKWMRGFEIIFQKFIVKMSSFVTRFTGFKLSMFKNIIGLFVENVWHHL